MKVIELLRNGTEEQIATLFNRVLRCDECFLYDSKCKGFMHCKERVKLWLNSDLQESLKKWATGR